MLLRLSIILLVLLFGAQGGASYTSEVQKSSDSEDVTEGIAHPTGALEPELLQYGYSGKERFLYDVSWSGGVKIGELRLEVNSLNDVDGGYEIRAHVSTRNGDIHVFYPVEDLYVTKVKGPKMLPFHYEAWQKQGYRYRAHREVSYDQQRWFIHYMKNKKLEGEYQLEGEVNNEFSSFFNSRLMKLKVGDPFLVPTFADKKRKEVVVHPIKIETVKNTIIGDVAAIAIMPIMEFKGLYKKKGDTVIWYTNDECRVPVKIKSKIVLGSLMAVLKDYENPACDRYSVGEKKKTN